MSYSYDKFLRPITTTDRNIQIVNNDGIIDFTINPFSVLDTFVLANVVKISLRSKRIISIAFSTSNESKLAISLLQQQLDTLRNKVPLLVDKQIENYVEDKISQVDVNFGNGLTYNSGTVSVGGNLYQSLLISGNSYDLFFNSFDNIIFTSSVFDTVSDFISLDSKDSLQILSDNDITITSFLGQFSLSAESGLISIGNTQGLVYYTDYSSGFVTHSLVDKKYVDDAIDSVAVGITNSFQGLVVSGLTVLEEVSEVIDTSFNVTSSPTTYDFSTGANWYHSSASTNYTANFTNVPTIDGRAITVTIVISQGATAYVPNVVQINGSGQTIKWSGSSTGNSNQTDIIGFTFIRVSGSWVVLGQINTFV